MNSKIFTIMILLFLTYLGCSGGNGVVAPGDILSPEEFWQLYKDYTLPGKVIAKANMSYSFGNQGIDYSIERAPEDFTQLTTADVDLTFEFLDYDGYVDYGRRKDHWDGNKRSHGLRYRMSIRSTDEAIPRVMAIVAPKDMNNWDFWFDQSGGFNPPFYRELVNRDGFAAINSYPGYQPYIAVGEVPVSTAQVEEIEFQLKLPSSDLLIQDWDVLIFQMDELWEDVQVPDFNLFDSDSSIVDENFWRYEQVASGASLSCKGETNFSYQGTSTTVAAFFVYDQNDSYFGGYFNGLTGRYESEEVTVSNPPTGKMGDTLLVSPMLIATVDVPPFQTMLMVNFYEIPYRRYPEGYFMMTSQRPSPEEGRSNMSIINSDTGEVLDLPAPDGWVGGGGNGPWTWGISDRIAYAKAQEFRIVLDGEGPDGPGIFVTDITATASADYWAFDDYINLNEMIGYDETEGIHEQQYIDRRLFPAISDFPSGDAYDYTMPDLIAFVEDVEIPSDPGNYYASIEGVILGRNGEYNQWMHDMQFDESCVQLESEVSPSAFSPQVSGYVDGFVVGYTPLKGYQDYALQAAGLCKVVWDDDQEAYQLSADSSDHEYYEFDSGELLINQSQKARVYLSDDGRLVAFEDLEFGANSVKAFWVDTEGNNFDIEEGTGDSLIRTFPYGYGGGDQHFAAVAGHIDDSPEFKVISEYLIVFQQGMDPHNSIFAAAYKANGTLEVGNDELCDPVDLTSDLPFPLSQWKPDCKTFNNEQSGTNLGGVGFTTQDNGGEAIIVYLRMDYDYSQPIRNTDIIRLTWGGKIKMVRMSGLIEYAPIE